MWFISLPLPIALFGTKNNNNILCLFGGKEKISISHPFVNKFNRNSRTFHPFSRVLPDEGLQSFSCASKNSPAHMKSRQTFAGKENLVEKIKGSRIGMDSEKNNKIYLIKRKLGEIV